ncbi:hypothetical protein VTO73DRAFT_13655 [Trametes versicolor]
MQATCATSVHDIPCFAARRHFLDTGAVLRSEPGLTFETTRIPRVAPRSPVRTMHRAQLHTNAPTGIDSSQSTHTYPYAHTMPRISYVDDLSSLRGLQLIITATAELHPGKIAQ